MRRRSNERELCGSVPRGQSPDGPAALASGRASRASSTRDIVSVHRLPPMSIEPPLARGRLGRRTDRVGRELMKRNSDLGSEMGTEDNIRAVDAHTITHIEC